MLTSTPDTNVKSVFRKEIRAICGYYGIPYSTMDPLIFSLKSAFEKYWEMVFSENDFELITAGQGSVFAQQALDAAAKTGLSQKMLWLFFNCHLAFPSAITGIKLCFSAGKKLSPTLYVRLKTEMKEGFTFLRQHLNDEEVSLLQNALRDNKILYGLGFSEKDGKSYLKTYTIGDVEAPQGGKTEGFISHRLSGQQLSKEHKTYLPEISLENFQAGIPGLGELRNFLVSEMGYVQAGHIGILHRENNTPEYKIYVERKGGIPTDFSAR